MCPCTRESEAGQGPSTVRACARWGAADPPGPTPDREEVCGESNPPKRLSCGQHSCSHVRIRGETEARTGGVGETLQVELAKPSSVLSTPRTHSRLRRVPSKELLSTPQVLLGIWASGSDVTCLGPYVQARIPRMGCTRSERSLRAEGTKLKGINVKSG